ncbi:MAG: hypothetical protein H6718_17755 [Polyangiaceae bacterium]|nr:hypothetical protein [Myxococcales bacterium]MCB9587249.1 hypothetical protein [Polyangiaceae bacterium]MCB9609368.1 hypothetical protein [Polyangiaceae bacterium]
MSDEDLDAIPTKGIKPTYIAAGAGFIALCVVAFVMIKVVSGSKVPDEDPNAAAAAPVDTSSMTPEELKKHLELTRKGLSIADEEAAKQKAAEDAAKRAKEEQEKQAEAPSGGTPSGGAAKAPTSGKAAKKQAAKLDDIASDITGALK